MIFCFEKYFFATEEIFFENLKRVISISYQKKQKNQKKIKKSVDRRF